MELAHSYGEGERQLRDGDGGHGFGVADTLGQTAHRVKVPDLQESAIDKTERISVRTRAVRSLPQEARMEPSALQSSARTVSVWPDSIWQFSVLKSNLRIFALRVSQQGGKATGDGACLIGIGGHCQMAASVYKLNVDHLVIIAHQQLVFRQGGDLGEHDVVIGRDGEDLPNFGSGTATSRKNHEECQTHNCFGSSIHQASDGDPRRIELLLGHAFLGR